ncbi:MAG: adenylate/guanylate cyclase domain-containing protein [Verrucomicrobiota bacterium]
MNTTTLSELGQRKLAAIAFTDVVNYSGMMNRNEERTLQRLQHHFKRMSEFAEQWRGQVVKTTGDGLMIYFESAIDAVSWALDVQNRVSSGHQATPSEERMQHRIGIHLGDVFFKDGDVMGDGVNIAARLQAEADPGGICISQTVYDVVKMKMNVQATFLGDRELKNIKESVPIYQILLNAQKQIIENGDAPAVRVVKSKAEAVEPSMNSKAWIGAVVLALFVAGVPAGLWFLQKRSSEKLPSTSADVAMKSPHQATSEPRLPSQQTGASNDKAHEVLSFLKQKLSSYHRENPLHLTAITTPNGRQVPEMDVWMESDSLMVRRDGQEMNHAIHQTPRPMLARIAMELVKQNPNDPMSQRVRETIQEKMRQNFSKQDGQKGALPQQGGGGQFFQPQQGQQGFHQPPPNPQDNSFQGPQQNQNFQRNPQMKRVGQRQFNGQPPPPQQDEQMPSSLPSQQY